MTNVNKYIGHLNKYITVILLSSKAKNRLANQMEKNPVVLIERKDGVNVFCVSMNRNYFFWMSKTGDKDWAVIK